MNELFVLVHSPVVGPVTWRPVAERLEERGWETVVPSLVGITEGEPPYWPKAVEAVRHALAEREADQPVVLVGHSNSGVLLPAIAEGVSQPVVASIFVDAAMPAAQGATDLSQDDAFFMLRSLADDEGVLPPWDEWFGAEAMAKVMPDPGLRARISAELPRLPLRYYRQSIPVPSDWPDHPVTYLRFSEGYRTEQEIARERGWRLRELPGLHLHQVVEPDAVAAELAAAVNVP